MYHAIVKRITRKNFLRVIEGTSRRSSTTARQTSVIVSAATMRWGKVVDIDAHEDSQAVAENLTR